MRMPNIHAKSATPKTPVKPANRGFTLVELMVGLGLASSVLLATVSYQSYVQQQHKQDEGTISRNEILTQIRRNAASPWAMRKSINDPANANLVKCVQGTGGGTCTAGALSPLRLHDTVDALVTEAIPGWTYFTSKGSPCPAADATCAFRAQTAFIPRCLNNNCTVPENVTIETQYAVEPNPTYAAKSPLAAVRTPPAMPVSLPAISILAGYYYYYF